MYNYIEHILIRGITKGDSLWPFSWKLSSFCFPLCTCPVSRMLTCHWLTVQERSLWEFTSRLCPLLFSFPSKNYVMHSAAVSLSLASCMGQSDRLKSHLSRRPEGLRPALCPSSLPLRGLLTLTGQVPLNVEWNRLPKEAQSPPWRRPALSYGHHGRPGQAAVTSLRLVQATRGEGCRHRLAEVSGQCASVWPQAGGSVSLGMEHLQVLRRLLADGVTLAECVSSLNPVSPPVKWWSEQGLGNGEGVEHIWQCAGRQSTHRRPGDSGSWAQGACADNDLS